jgi:replicative DNA helicase
MNEIEEARNKKGSVGISTGSEDIDDMIGGFCKGDQLVIAARPGMGKTTFAAGLLIEVVKQNIPVMFYSLEMTKARFMQVLAAIVSGISTKKMRNGSINEKEGRLIQDALDWLYKKPIYISTSAKTIDQIIGSARYHARKNGVKVFFYDYIQIFKGGEKSWNTTYRIGDYSQRLKSFANDYKVSNVVLCQVNRDIEKNGNREPRLSDIKDSGSIEQDASSVIMMHKPEPDQSPKLFNLFLRKNRFGDLAFFERLWVNRKFIMTGQPIVNRETESTPF